jgi:3-hydroxymyristoyl/3-hydroxydecanoyl-(acyl carrier protein) dehydratase
MEHDNSWYTLVQRQTTADGAVAVRVTIDIDSPWFDGHFPNDPILPGIAQLYMVADCMAAAGVEGMFPGNISRIKFKKIVRPGELLDILATRSNKKDQYTFRITSGDEEVCSGMMRFQRKSDHYNKTTKTL